MVITSTTGNRVVAKSGSRVRISPTPPKVRTPERASFAFGGTQALVEGASIALYSGGGSSAAYNAAVASGKMLIRETFAAKTLTFAQTIYPILKLKPIYRVLWGKLSYDFALGASSADIFLNGSGIYEKSAFYC